MSDKLKIFDASEKVDTWAQSEIVPKMQQRRPFWNELQAVFGSVEKTLERIIAADERRHELAGKLRENFSAADLSAYHWLTEARLRTANDFKSRVRDLVPAIMFILGFGFFASLVFADPAMLTWAFYVAAFVAAMHIGLAIFAGRRQHAAEELNEITKLALDESCAPLGGLSAAAEKSTD